MKIPVTSINNINALLAEVETDYFDLLSYYHYPFSMFDSKAQPQKNLDTHDRATESDSEKNWRL